MAMACSELLAEADGRETVFGLVRAALSPQLRATAYALACDVIAVDGRLQPNEMQALEHIRAKLEVDPAVARAIERVAVIRFQAA
jgi:tellurite resistance protein